MLSENEISFATFGKTLSNCKSDTPLLLIYLAVYIEWQLVQYNAVYVIGYTPILIEMCIPYFYDFAKVLCGRIVILFCLHLIFRNLHFVSTDIQNHINLYEDISTYCQFLIFTQAL
mgnify:CR=1 FL=1